MKKSFGSRQGRRFTIHQEQPQENIKKTTLYNTIATENQEMLLSQFERKRNAANETKIVEVCINSDTQSEIDEIENNDMEFAQFTIPPSNQNQITGQQN